MEGFKIYSAADIDPAKLPPRPNVDHLVEAARDMRREPPSSCPVRKSRASRPILWSSRQWAVTKWGLECHDGGYPIEKDRLWDLHEEDHYGWVRHMRSKVWVDINDFTEALRVARLMHYPENRHRRR